MARREWLAEALRVAGKSQHHLARDIHVHHNTPGRWVRGEQNIELRHRGPIAAALDISREDLDRLEAHYQSQTNRRDVLKLGIGATLAPGALGALLSHAATETAGFTRRASASMVGQAALDHLELVVSEVSAAYSRSSPTDVFVAAHGYRQQIDGLLQAPHTLKEARQLYVLAGWLSETLAWVSHDLGHPVAADAYSVDAFEHANQAGHDELCAWAMDARASISLRDRPDKALDAALKGIAWAPKGHPLAVRLHAQVARAFARLGRHDDFLGALRAAQDRYDQLPSRTPARFSGKDTAKLAEYAITSYPTNAYLSLGMWDAALPYAERAVAVHARTPERDRSPSREAIARLDLAAVRLGQSEPDEAARLGHEALESSRVVTSVLARAATLAEMMQDRYPELPTGQELTAAINEHGTEELPA